VLLLQKREDQPHVPTDLVLQIVQLSTNQARHFNLVVYELKNYKMLRYLNIYKLQV